MDSCPAQFPSLGDTPFDSRYFSPLCLLDLDATALFRLFGSLETDEALLVVPQTLSHRSHLHSTVQLTLFEKQGHFVFLCPGTSLQNSMLSLCFELPVPQVHFASLRTGAGSSSAPELFSHRLHLQCLLHDAPNFLHAHLDL